MTALETIDTVTKHLLTQGRKAQEESADGEMMCCYRTRDGAKCAAGCLISDDVYKPFMEGLSCDSTTMSPIIRNLGYDVRLVRRLQRVHDEYDVDTWADRLAEIRAEYAETE